MDRIYCESFLEKSYPQQMALIEHVRTLRSSAINAAKIGASKLTKSAKRNIAKGKSKSKRKPKNPTKAATAALNKLSPAQIELIKAQFQTKRIKHGTISDRRKIY